MLVFIDFGFATETLDAEEHPAIKVLHLVLDSPGYYVQKKKPLDSELLPVWNEAVLQMLLMCTNQVSVNAYKFYDIQTFIFCCSLVLLIILKSVHFIWSVTCVSFCVICVYLYISQSKNNGGPRTEPWGIPHMTLVCPKSLNVCLLINISVDQRYLYGVKDYVYSCSQCSFLCQFHSA